jgi:SAM-dependent methyltransferase
MMERLDLGSSSRYDGLEAAIHMGRYALVRELCRGKRVLDMACGEGYGSQLMRRWGAEAVLGVDASQAAVDKASALFRDANVEFRRARVEDLTPEFLGGQFDLAVCIETIEHVPEPARLLRLLRASVRPGGAIVVTCPNDHWYYPGEGERNLFHLRKYTFEEFRAFAESELGPAQWILGTGVLGFCNVPLKLLAVADDSTEQIAMMQSRCVATDIVPSPMQAAPTPATAAYYVGVWGAACDAAFAGAAFPVSMDRVAAAVSVSADAERDEVARGRWVALQAEMRALVEGAVPALVQEAADDAGARDGGEDRAALLAQALQRENRLLRDRLDALAIREAGLLADAAAAGQRAGELALRVTVAEDLSSQWSSALNAERQRLAAVESGIDALRRELEASKLRLSLIERDRAALRLRIDELELELVRPVPAPVAAPPAPVSGTSPSLVYRIYRRSKNLVPAGVRRGLGPKIARWLPRP